MTSKFSRWMQHTMNARANRKIRNGKGAVMGMELLVLNTVGRRSGRPRETPVAWFADGDNGWLIVASGGGDQHPDWYANLMAHPDRASVELPGRGPVPVTARTLAGEDRARAWKIITTANPRMGRYQSRSAREYPVIRLTPR